MRFWDAEAARAGILKTNEIVLFALACAFILAAGCIDAEPKDEVKIKKVSVSPANFSELLDLNLSLECSVNAKTGPVRLLTAPGGIYLDEMGDRKMVKRDGIVYLLVFDGAQLPEGAGGCRWVMLNDSDAVYRDWIDALGPRHESFSLMPGSAFDCDLASPNSGELQPSGHICWYFDIAR